MVSYSMVPQPEIELDMKSQNSLHKQKNPITSANAVDPTSPTQHAHQSLRRRLGTWSIVVLAASTLTIFAVVIFLSLLWRSGTAGSSHGYRWAQQIARNQATVKAVTLSAVVLRLAVALQAGICTSLAAALILERNKVPLPDLLHFAAIRSISSSPPTILYPIGRQLRLYIRSLPAVLIILIFLTTTLLQLTSFLLVVDTGLDGLNSLQSSRVMNFTNDKDTTDFAMSKFYNINYWGSRPRAYYPFGEFQSGSRKTESMYDTGTIFQGMPPSNDPYWVWDTRLLETVTTVFASRIACVAPTIEATVQQYADTQFAYLIGNVTIDATGIEPLRCGSNEPSDCVIAFNCSLPTLSITMNSTDLPPVNEWVLGVCAVQQSSIWSFGTSLFDTANSTVNSTVNSTDEPATDVAGVYGDITMVLNHTGLQAIMPKWLARNSSVGNYTKRSQEWTTYSLAENEYMDLSLCVSKFESQHKYVQMTSNHSFPTIEVDWDTDNDKYNTARVQRLFDISDQLLKPGAGLQPRGVMNMTLPPFDDGKIPAGTLTEFSQVSGLALFGTNPNSDTAGAMLPGCPRCAGGQSINLHPLMSSLFQDIITRTRRPALALQTLFSIVTQSAYYEDSTSFNVGYEAKYVTADLAVLPYMFFGFTVVTCLLGTHLLVVASMVYLFARRTKYSMVGEMWHSMGQVMEHVPEHLLSESMGRTDVEIRKACRRSGTSRSGVSMYRDFEDGQARERK